MGTSIVVLYLLLQLLQYKHGLIKSGENVLLENVGLSPIGENSIGEIEEGQ